MAERDPTVLGIPTRVWLSALGALLIGVIILIVLHMLEDWEWFKNAVGESFHWKDITRDIGIAFLVAGVVSLIYEWSTRTSEERHKIASVLGTVMSAYATEEIWNEVNAEVFRRRVVRRNFDVKLTITKKDGLPDNQRVLTMEAKYDLYGLKMGNLKVDVRHYLDKHMEATNLNLPRFESVEVIKFMVKNVTYKEVERTEYKSAALDSICKEDGSMRLEGEQGIDLPSFYDGGYVRINIKRHEIINTPGLYTLVMPEMIVPDVASASPAQPTIKISVVPPLPGGIEIEVYTWFPTHKFNKSPDGTVWTFNGVMLAGQGFSIIFKVIKTMKDSTAMPSAASE